MSQTGGDVAERDQQAARPSTAASHAGGRPPADIRQDEFTAIGKRDPTAKRTGAKCKHCGKVINAKQAKVEELFKHIQQCTGKTLTPERRLYWQQQQAGAAATSTAGEDAAAAGKKRKTSSQLSSTGTQSRVDAHMGSRLTALSASAQEEINLALLRWAACSNIPFRAFDSPHLAAAIRVLRPGYQAPSPTLFRSSLLPKEYSAVMTKVQFKIKVAQNLTLAVDAWTDRRKRSVVAFLVHLPDRSCFLLETREASLDSHTGEYMAGTCTTPSAQQS
jgi:hypothetical protein